MVTLPRVKGTRRGVRGGRKNKANFSSNNNQWTIYQSNIRGYISKAFSFGGIVAGLQPSVIVLNETHLKHDQKLKIPGYNSFNRNRGKKCIGGIATSIKNVDAMHVLKVTEGENENEFLITRHGQFVVPINIINVYGQQEGTSSKDDILKRWDNIMKEVVKIEATGEHLIILGDLNCHVGDIIEGNDTDISVGGDLIRNLLSTEHYILVNSTDKTEGGPHTRFDPSDPQCLSKKSCLDLAIISSEVMKYVDKLTIDSQMKYVASRPVTKKKVVYPDHYPLILTFKNIPLNSSQISINPKFTMWDTNKVGGWEAYQAMTENNVKLREIAEDTIEDNPDKIMTAIRKELDKVKFAAFGKVKVKLKPKADKELVNLQKQKIDCFDADKDESKEEKIKELDIKIAEHLILEQRKQFEKELLSMKELRKTALIFNLKDKIVGKRKVGQEATVLIDPKTKEEVNTPAGIKKVSIDYCQDLLTNREPKADYKEDLELKQIIHQVRMVEKVENDIEFSQEIFQTSLDMLKKKNGHKYDFIIKSGESYKAALFTLFKIVWERERKPDIWRNTVLLQLFIHSYKARRT